MVLIIDDHKRNVMFLKNLKYSFRNFRNQKLFTIVNLTGLTIGIIAASFIFVFIRYELSFDRFHKNSDNIFRLYSTSTRDGVTEEWVQTPAPVASFLENKFPQIAKTVRITRLSKSLVSYGEKSFFEEKIILADSSIFDVFTFPLLIGSRDQVFSQPNSVVLTESAAEKYFGKNDPVGKTFRFNRSIDLTVTGLMKDIPGNSHLQFDMVIPMSGAKLFFADDFLKNPVNTVMSLYLLMNPETDIDKLNKSVGESTNEYLGGMFSGYNILYHLQPVTSIHLHSNMGGEFSPNSDVKSVNILFTIALMILIIACINYVNLSFTLNRQRLTELGMRKIMGAKRIQIISLYLSDATLLVGISVLISVLFIYDKIPWFNELLGVKLTSTEAIKNLFSILSAVFLIITIVTGLAAGWLSSGISPLTAIKKPLFRGKRNISTQGILVLLQFAISIILISSTLFVNRQMKFIQNRDLGLSKDQLIIIPLNDNKIKSKKLTFKQELLSNPNIISAGLTSDLPGKLMWVGSVNFEGSNEEQPLTMTYLEIDKDFFKTYGVHLKEGYLPGDTTCPFSGTQFLLNESAVRKLGWNSPLGKIFSSYRGKEGHVTGIISDFNFKSLHKEIEPLFLFLRDADSKFLAVKVSTSGISSSVDYIKQVWNKIVPDSPFEFYFYDEFYNNLYKKEMLFGKIIFIFSAIAILIACMGLFALAAFLSAKRNKEIGIRKVNGAAITEIMALLNKEFLKWVIIAFVIAVPIAWYVMDKWLQSFAYKTELSLWIFCVSGVIALVIALLTVSWQSLRSATRNPAESLRYE